MYWLDSSGRHPHQKLTARRVCSSPMCWRMTLRQSPWPTGDGRTLKWRHYRQRRSRRDFCKETPELPWINSGGHRQPCAYEKCINSKFQLSNSSSQTFYIETSQYDPKQENTAHTQLHFIHDVFQGNDSRDLRILALFIDIIVEAFSDAELQLQTLGFQ